MSLGPWNHVFWDTKSEFQPQHGMNTPEAGMTQLWDAQQIDLLQQLLKESWNATQKTPLDPPNLLHSYVNNKCSWSILSIHVHKILEKFVLICTFLHENIDKILVVGIKGSRRSAHHLLHSVKVSQTCRWEKQNEKCRRTRGIEEGADYSHSDVLLTFISLLLWNLSLFPDEINYPIFKL